MEMPQSILNDMIARGVKPTAGKCWKRLQLDRMSKNEKYVGDVILQKTYIENHINHRQIRNHRGLPQFHVENARVTIVDRHMIDRAQKIMTMRNVAIGNSTYPHGELLRCPHCGKVLIHGSLNNFYYGGEKIQNGGWGCYREGGCESYLLIQNRRDEALIATFEEKYGERKETVEFYWLDDTVESIELDERTVSIRWKDGNASAVEMDFSEGQYTPFAYADFYNEFLNRVRSGEKKNKYMNLMGLNMGAGMKITRIAAQKLHTKTRVAVYCRVSTDKDTQEDSLEMKEDAYRALSDLNPELQLVGVYSDIISGMSAEKRWILCGW